MTVKEPLFVLITLASSVVISTILMLFHLFKKFLTRKIFLIIVALISIIACVVSGLYEQLSLYKLIAGTAVITAIMVVGFTFAIYSAECLTKMIRDLLRDDNSKQ